MSKNLKFCHVAYKITEPMKQALEEVPPRGGMYNWMFVFKGGIRAIHDLKASGEIENYDVIQVNLSPVDQLLVKELRDMLKNSSTLLVANNDYVTESWDEWGQHPLQYSHYQEYADVVFGTEPYQTSCMQEGAYCIPHPHRIDILKKIGNDDLEPERFKVGALYHWWEGRTYHTSLLFEKLRKKYPRLISRLYGYWEPGKDKCKRWQKVMFDKQMPLMNFPDFMRSLQTNRFIVENCGYHTYGRTTVDTAALRVPSIGTDRVFSMKHCFPKMSCDPFDQKKMLEIANKVLNDKDWVNEQMDYAYEACEYFNYDNSRDRFMKMVDETRERLKK